MHRDADHDDCEDQGMGATGYCLKFPCHSAWSPRQYLELVGKYWCCPKCGGSYGEEGVTAEYAAAWHDKKSQPAQSGEGE